MTGEWIPEGWIDTEAAQELTGYSLVYLYKLARQGKVPARKVGRAWWYDRDALAQWQAAARPGRKPTNDTEV